jgi:hypothetical protein
MRILLNVLCVALAACAHTSIPGDVQRFVERRDACDHFRGEFPDPPDPARVKEVLAMISQYCTGTDAQLAELRAHYQTNAAISKKLSEYETVVEKNRK